ncbi:MAG: single-stranded DNA-binding protein [Coriobacteriales bacterium]|jgi:single-strand DNA-binding protein|nr:single-stranded DNA-binding protein [Coriobacteriales bacterium]
MARNINRVIITGNLTRDPELRTTPGGTQVLQIGVAVNDSRKNPQTGSWDEYPNFIDCVTFGNRAGALANLLHKGSRVAIEGKLRWSSWQAQDGSKRSKIEVIIDELELLTPRSGASGGYVPTDNPSQVPTSGAPASGEPEIKVYDDDIPF